MKNPFHTLGITEEADDEAIRAAQKRALKSLAKKSDGPTVRRRQEIQSAYRMIRDLRSRTRSRLFMTWEARIDQMLGPILVSADPSMPSREKMLEGFTRSLAAYRLESGEEKE